MPSMVKTFNFVKEHSPRFSQDPSDFSLKFGKIEMTLQSFFSCLEVDRYLYVKVLFW